MVSDMEISVVVVTYNQDLKRILLTLKSIINQKFMDYELIISDDGSKYNYFDEIKNYFQENNFTRYKLLPSETNRGTVKNIIKALEQCCGKYVKVIGAGDLLYNEDSLETICECFRKEDCDLCFGLMRGFRFAPSGEIKLRTSFRPYNIQAYRKKVNINMLQKYLVLYEDHIYGASFAYKKDYILSSLKKIEGSVIYLEDIIQVEAALKEEKVYFYDDYLFWYEVDAGVSAGKNHMQGKIRKDYNNYYKYISELYPDNKYIKKRKKWSKIYDINNYFLRYIAIFFHSPSLAFFVLYHIIQRHTRKHEPDLGTKGFLDEKDFLKLGKEGIIEL